MKGVKRAAGAVILVALAWILAWAAILGVNAHRAYVGRLGDAEWTPRARDVRFPDSYRAASATNAAFELQIAQQAEDWERRALIFGLGVGLPIGAAALWIVRGAGKAGRAPV
jgi:hypothetical protein